MLRDDITEKYQDILQNIEFAIARAYDFDRALLDVEVIDVLDAAIRRYASESQGRMPSSHRLVGRAATAYPLVERMCEWRLGRGSMGGAAGTPQVLATVSLGVDELLLCLKRVRKSARFWNEQAGRQGYLQYVSQFV